MAILYVAAAFVFFMWWVRGNFIPAAFLAFCCGCLILLVILLAYNEYSPIGPALTGGTMPIVWVVAILSFAPWYIRQQIERRRAEAQERALHGVRFNGD